MLKYYFDINIDSNKLLDSEKETINRIIDNKIYYITLAVIFISINEAMSFWENLFNKTYKTNPYLYKTVLSGVCRVAQESIFSEANNFTVYSVMRDNSFSSDFGFTHEFV